MSFLSSELLPALSEVILDEHRVEVGRALAETKVTFEDRLTASQEAEAALDAVLRPHLPVPESADIVVVGAGLAGLTISGTLSDAAQKFIVLEKSSSAGGQWRWSANFSSRVNSSEPSYRLPFTKRAVTNTNHSHHFEILGDITLLIEQHDLTHRLHTQSPVRSVTSVEGGWLIDGRQPEAQRKFSCRSQVTVLCTNRRLGAPRHLSYPGESTFRGQICRGLGGDSDGLSCKGERVVVLGMGERNSALTPLLCDVKPHRVPDLSVCTCLLVALDRIDHTHSAPPSTRPLFTLPALYPQVPSPSS